MAFYITETAVANELKDSSSFLVTQPESVGDSEPVESLRRVRLDEVRRVVGAEAMEGVRSIISRLENLESAAIGKLYTEVARTEMGYGDQKEVPEGALKWATVNKIFGKTVAINQINENSSTSSTYKGVTFTNRGDGYWTAYGEMTEANCFKNLRANNTYGLFQFGHKYAILGNRPNLYIACNGVTNDLMETGYRDGLSDRIIEKTNPINECWARLQVPDSMIGRTVNETICPLIVDLTAMFGKGNEPETIEEVKAMLPKSVYAYREPGITSMNTEKIVSMIGSNSVIDTLDMHEIIAKYFPNGMHGITVNILNNAGSSSESYRHYTFEDTLDFEEGVATVACGISRLGYYGAWEAVYGEEPNDANRFTTAAGAIEGAQSYCIFSPQFPETVQTSLPDKAGQINISSNGKVSVCVSRALTGITADESEDGKLSKFRSWLDKNGMVALYGLKTPVTIEIERGNRQVKVDGGGKIQSVSAQGEDYNIPSKTEGVIPVRIAR